MSRDYAGKRYIEIQEKYGGWDGMLEAYKNGTIDPDELREYFEASRVLGLG